MLDCIRVKEGCVGACFQEGSEIGLLNLCGSVDTLVSTLADRQIDRNTFSVKHQGVSERLN